MALYIAAYGLTVKRVLASVFLVWMACVFVCVILRQFRTVALVRVAVFLGAVLFALLCVLPVGTASALIMPPVYRRARWIRM